jgi:hypothetical protein
MRSNLPDLSDDADTVIFSGVFSTIFLLMVDTEKSRIECEEFVAAECNFAVFGEDSM